MQKQRKQKSMIHESEIQWFGGKPMSIKTNAKWAQSVKKDSKLRPEFVLNRVPLGDTIKGFRRITEPSIMQNLNSSLDLNPFPISKSKEASNENNFLKNQTGGRKIKATVKKGGYRWKNKI